MAALPATSQPTVDAIFAGYEADQESGYRYHLGASLIGRECDRSLWYSFRWATRAWFTGRMLRLFQTGHLEEARFVAELRRAGITVHDTDPETGKQIGVRDEGGHFGGSLDAAMLGVKEAPATWHVGEFKTHNAKSYAKLVKDGVQKSKPRHYAQMQVYMHLTGMTRAFYLARNKDTDELYSERLNYDIDFAIRTVARANRIINAPNPPTKISADPGWFECRFCDHHPVCHGEEMPAAHCRSCLHSTPIEGGEWHCAARDILLTREEQEAGCKLHLFIPELVPGEQTDTGKNHDGSSYIVYRMPDGTLWVNGE